ncbi:MAG: hypothetical protein WC657_00240 [Candidatus Paceibacterota bacterium]
MDASTVKIAGSNLTEDANENIQRGHFSRVFGQIFYKIKIHQMSMLEA